MVYRGSGGCRLIVVFHETGMITAAAPAYPRIQVGVTSAMVPRGG
jgi:hypothetical protein